MKLLFGDSNGAHGVSLAAIPMCIAPHKGRRDLRALIGSPFTWVAVSFQESQSTHELDAGMVRAARRLAFRA